MMEIGLFGKGLDRRVWLKGILCKSGLDGVWMRCSGHGGADG